MRELNEEAYSEENNIRRNNDMENKNQNNSNSLQDESGMISMRLGFIRKVYGILLFQLSITVICCVLSFIESVRMFMLENIDIVYFSTGLLLVMTIPLLCFSQFWRWVPWNYIYLIVWTDLLSYNVAVVCAASDPMTVLIAAFATLLITSCLTAYACLTKSDYTNCGPYLFGLLCDWIIFSLMLFFLPFLSSLYCLLGLILYSAYLVYDTQMIMMKFQNSYEIDDYILAAMNIYLDIIHIFLKLLELLSRMRN